MSLTNAKESAEKKEKDNFENSRMFRIEASVCCFLGFA